MPVNRRGFTLGHKPEPCPKNIYPRWQEWVEKLSIIRWIRYVMRNAHYLMNSQKQYVAANSYTRGVLWPSKYAKMRFRPGLYPGPRWGSLRRSPRSHSWMGRGYPLPYLTLLGARYSASLAPRFRGHCPPYFVVKPPALPVKRSKKSG